MGAVRNWIYKVAHETVVKIIATVLAAVVVTGGAAFWASADFRAWGHAAVHDFADALAQAHSWLVAPVIMPQWQAVLLIACASTIGLWLAHRLFGVLYALLNDALESARRRGVTFDMKVDVTSPGAVTLSAGLGPKPAKPGPGGAPMLMPSSSQASEPSTDPDLSELETTILQWLILYYPGGETKEDFPNLTGKSYAVIEQALDRLESVGLVKSSRGSYTSDPQVYLSKLGRDLCVKKGWTK